MIVCAVDDLIFSVKISTAAKAARRRHLLRAVAPTACSPTVREKQPSLVIFDLNSARLRADGGDRRDEGRPGAAGDQDARLRLARRHGRRSTAARQAGIDQVLARSAFAERLGEILTSGSSIHVRPARTTTRGQRRRAITAAIASDAGRRSSSALLQLLFVAGHAARVEDRQRCCAAPPANAAAL